MENKIKFKHNNNFKFWIFKKVKTNKQTNQINKKQTKTNNHKQKVFLFIKGL